MQFKKGKSKDKQFKAALHRLFGDNITCTGKYLGSRVQTTFECIEGHEYSTSPETALKGIGCKICYNAVRFEKIQAAKYAKGERNFIARVQQIFGPKVKILMPYTGTRGPMKIKCKNGHIIKAARSQDLEGCRRCNKKNYLNNYDYQGVLNKKFQKRITALAPYAGSYVSIKHLCSVHGEFEATPQHMLNKTKHGCVNCGFQARNNANRISEELVHARIKKKHGNKVKLIEPYTYSLDLLTFQCNKKHKWRTTPDSVMRLSGCPKCNQVLGFSTIACEWIDKFGKRYGLNFLHSKNGGEVSLKGKSGKKYWVDGYNPEKKVILEFHGDNWHGNPAIWEPDDYCNPWSSKTAGELLRATQKREHDLADAGYQVINVWQSDYLRGYICSEVIGKNHIHV